jgi:hypothetical protein
MVEFTEYCGIILSVILRKEVVFQANLDTEVYWQAGAGKQNPSIRNSPELEIQTLSLIDLRQSVHFSQMPQRDSVWSHDTS